MKKKVPRKKVSEINCLFYGQIHSYVKHKQENSDGWINNHANYIPDFLFKKKKKTPIHKIFTSENIIPRFQNSTSSKNQNPAIPGTFSESVGNVVI